MKGDFTRLTFDRAKHYSGIRMQQGRIQLDADWNELGDIQAHRMHTESEDFIGPSGAPDRHPGFEITTDGNDLTIAKGRMYVDGVLCENEADVSIRRQPDLPGPLPDTDGQYLAYIDVWQRHITTLEDPALRETGLGGPDTGTRVKTVWQVKLEPMEAEADVDTVWARLVAPSTATLEARVDPAKNAQLRTGLYRVEVHRIDSSGKVFIKWSRNNASTVAGWKGLNGNELTVEGVGAAPDIRAEQWIELSDETRELRNDPGTLVEVMKAEGERLTIDPATATGPIEWPADGVDGVHSVHSVHPKVRRWDSKGEIEIEPAGPLPLEDGIEIELGEGTLRPGDYWLIPARRFNRDIEWPRIDVEAQAVPPHGVERRYSRLALVKLEAETWSKQEDLRFIFSPLIDLRAVTALRSSLDAPDGTVYVNNEGKVGIGTKEPQSILHLKGDSASQVMSLVVQDELTSAPKSWRLGNDGQPGKFGLMDGGYKNYRWIVDSEGNVGIGTERPKARLDVDGNGSFVSHVNLWTDGERDWQVGHIGGIPAHDFGIADEVNNTGPARMVIQRGSGNVGIGTANPDAPLQIPFKYNTPNGGLRLYEGADDYWDIRNMSHGMAFDYSGTTKLVLQYAGNLGIGTKAPKELLELCKDDADIAIRLYNPGNNEFKIGTADDNLRIGPSPGNISVSQVNSLVINAGNGHVGIGTTPVSNHTLHVGGHILSTGPSAGYAFRDRNGSNDWAWYSDGTAARLYRSGSGNLLAIMPDGRVDIRTKLEVTGDLRVTGGNVGVGTPSPGKNLHIQGAGSAPLCNDGNDRPGLAITGYYPQLDLFSSVNNVNHGPTIRLGGYNDDAKSSFKHWVIGTAGRNATFLDIGFSGAGNSNPHTGIRNASGRTVLTLLESGNVGIGTLAPGKKLHIQGAGSAPLCNDGNDRPGLAITGYYPQLDLFSSVVNRSHGPTIRLGGYNDAGGFGHWSIGTAGRNASFLDIGCTNNNDSNPHAGIRGHNGRTVLTLLESGNVGIGKTAPHKTLDVNGVINAGGYIGGLGNINAHSLEVGGGSPTPGSRQATILLHHHNRVAHQLRYDNGNLALEAAPGYGTHPTPNLHIGGSIWARGNRLAGTDYAEYFESSNGKEIPAGTSVVLESEKIRRARKGETPIGIISANPAVVGGANREWQGKYLRDVFGSETMEKYKEERMAPKREKVTRERQKLEKKTVEEEMARTETVLEDGKYVQKEVIETVTREVDEPVFEEVDLYDEAGEEVIGQQREPVMETYEEEIDVLDDDGKPVLVGTGKYETRQRPKLNPDYDEAVEYVPREERPEWNCVGLLGKLPLRKGQPVAPTWIKMKDISNKIELWLVK